MKKKEITLEVKIKTLGGIFLLMIMPLNIYGQWLMYDHVQATNLMWFIFYITNPLWVVINIIDIIVIPIFKKIDEELKRYEK